MKLKNYLILFVAIAGIFMLSSVALSAPSASILYQETDLGEGLWQYDYTFENTSDSEYLYSVWLDFDTFYNITDPVLSDTWVGNWGAVSPTDYLEIHSNDFADDIAPGDLLGGFTFTVDSQIGSVPFTVYFDDHDGTRTYATGLIAAAATVVPEPVSSMLFIIGGGILGFRRLHKRKA